MTRMLLSHRFCSVAALALVVPSLWIPDLFASAAITDLSVQEFHDMAISGQVDLIIDVRSRTEYEQGHVPNATLYPNAGTVMAMLTAHDINATLLSMGMWSCLHSCAVVVTCRSYEGSAQVLNLLQNKVGWIGANLYNGQDYLQWMEAGYSLVTDKTPDAPCMNSKIDPIELEEDTDFCFWRDKFSGTASANEGDSDIAGDFWGDEAPLGDEPNDNNSDPENNEKETQPLENEAIDEETNVPQQPKEETPGSKCESLANGKAGGAGGIAKDCISINRNGGRKMRKLRGL